MAKPGAKVAATASAVSVFRVLRFEIMKVLRV
jgi:hypothetical protein